MNERRMDRRALFCLGVLLPAAAALTAAPVTSSPGAGCEPTKPDNDGPFYLPGAPRRTSIAGPREPAERVRIRGTVMAADCRTPLAGALLDILQADASGKHHGRGEDFRLRGQVMTNARGEYEFDTIRPGQYDLGGGMRLAHIHFTISSPEYEPLTTQLYFSGDPNLGENDPCGSGCDSDDPRRIIQPKMERAAPAVGHFDIVLRPTRA